MIRAENELTVELLEEQLKDNDLRELADLQLSLVGGGSADTIFA